LIDAQVAGRWQRCCMRAPDRLETGFYVYTSKRKVWLHSGAAHSLEQVQPHVAVANGNRQGRRGRGADATVRVAERTTRR
jgi:hypothetical protein